MVRELVCVAGAGSIVLVLRAGLAGRVKELHELSEAVGNLGQEEGHALTVDRQVGSSAPHLETMAFNSKRKNS